MAIPGRSTEILLVADNLSDTLLTIDALRASKVCCQVTVARGGREALAVLNGDGEYGEAHCPDLVLVDLDRSQQDGRALLAALQRSATACATPIAVLTGSPATEALVRRWAVPVDGYLRKPIDLEQFVRLVQEIAQFNMVVVTLLSDGSAGAAGAGPLPEQAARTWGMGAPECSLSQRRPARTQWRPMNNATVGWSSSRRVGERSRRRGSTGPR
jgi:two-component system response regulator